MSALEPASPAGGPDPGAAGARLGQLFESHARMVQGLCRLLLRNPEEAEDAAQQTFLSAHRALLAGNVPRDDGAWLAAIARNECRARARQRMREPLPLDDGLASVPGSSFDAAALAEQMGELKAALLTLPPKQREAVLLRDLFGLGYTEVATALGTSRPAVEALLFRGRRRLQDRLRPLRDVAAAFVVPDGLRAALEASVPGFAASTSSTGAVAAGAGLAKFGVPAAAKVAAAALAVGTAGTVAVGDAAPPTHRAAAAVPALVERDLKAVTPAADAADERPRVPVDTTPPPPARNTRAGVSGTDDDDDDDGDRQRERAEPDTDDDERDMRAGSPAVRSDDDKNEGEREDESERDDDESEGEDETDD